MGYGDGQQGRPENTTVDEEYTIYFRRTTTVADASEISGLTLEFLRDDGGVVYINNKEGLRSNMPDGHIMYPTWASEVVSEPAEYTFFPFSIDPALLLEGSNVLAVEMHQENAGSSDISFDLKLTAWRSQITSTFEGGVLRIFATTHDDSITLSADEQYYVTLNGERISPKVEAGEVEEILVYGYAGNDTIDLSGVDDADFTVLAASGAIRIEGGTGDDEMTGSADFGDTYVFSGSNLGTDSLNPVGGDSYLEDGDTILVAPDSVASIQGDFTMDEGSHYEAQVGLDGNGQIVMNNGVLSPGGSALNLNVLGDILPPDPAEPGARGFGAKTVRIVSTTENSSIDGEFSTALVPGVHLDRGIFVDRFGDGVQQTEFFVDVDLLQARAGDANGDHIVDIANDGSALLENLNEMSGMDWTKADFNHDGAVDIANDGSALLQNLNKPNYMRVSTGEADGYIDLDGNIFLEMEELSLYAVYVGNDAGEQLYHTDGLRMDDGVTDPAWVFQFSNKTNAVDSDFLESFAEMTTFGNYLTKEPLYDTLVNVNFDGLVGEATGIWLKYQQLGANPQIRELSVIGERGAAPGPANLSSGDQANLDGATLTYAARRYLSSDELAVELAHLPATGAGAALLEFLDELNLSSDESDNIEDPLVGLVTLYDQS